jgi:hypothetical protein
MARRQARPLSVAHPLGAGHRVSGPDLLTEGSEPQRRPPQFEGFHYVRVGQARARAAALCASRLDAQARFLLLVLAEVQRNGCIPMGPDAWEPALGVNLPTAELLVEQFTEVGLLGEDSDLWCLHVHGRMVDKGAGRRSHCGKEAAGHARRKARPRHRGYLALTRTGLPFRPPGTSPASGT